MPFPHYYRLLIIAAITLCSACAENLSPQEVAAKFWAAVESGDKQAVQKYITAADAIAIDSFDEVLAVSNPELTRIVIDGMSAVIDTTVTVEGDKPLNFPLKTHLVREDEAWKVDYAKTISAVANAGKLAQVIEKVHEFGNSLQQGIERSVEELENSLPQIEQELSRIEDQIKQHVPELRQRIENFTEELEQALKRGPTGKPRAGPESDPKVIAKPEDAVEI